MERGHIEYDRWGSRELKIKHTCTRTTYKYIQMYDVRVHTLYIQNTHPANMPESEHNLLMQPSLSP